jgi:hypothetical protein
MTLEEVSEIRYGEREHPLLHRVAPLVAAGAVWAARLAINRGYERVSGRPAPSPGDTRTSWRRAIAWTAVTASTAAVIEVSIRRVANQREAIRVLRRRSPSVVVASAHLKARPDEPLARLGARLLSAPATAAGIDVSQESSQT